MRMRSSVAAAVLAAGSVLVGGSAAHAAPEVLTCSIPAIHGEGACTAFTVGTAGTLTVTTAGYGYGYVDCYADPAAQVYVGGAYLQRDIAGTSTSYFDRFTYTSYCFAYGYHANVSAS
jgi:hypothetical protein